MICFSLVSYSFFGPNFFWLSWSRKNCIYFTLRSWIPWVPTRFQQQENHKRMNSEHSEKTGLWKSTGDGVKKSLFKRNWSFYSPAEPVCPVVFPHGLASTLPVKRRPPSPAVCSGTPLLGQVSPFRRSLFNTVASASSLPLFDHFTAR